MVKLCILRRLARIRRDKSELMRSTLMGNIRAGVVELTCPHVNASRSTKKQGNRVYEAIGLALDRGDPQQSFEGNCQIDDGRAVVVNGCVAFIEPLHRSQESL